MKDAMDGSESEIFWFVIMAFGIGSPVDFFTAENIKVEEPPIGMMSDALIKTKLWQKELNM